VKRDTVGICCPDGIRVDVIARTEVRWLAEVLHALPSADL
jgi:hypothetical protein